MIIHWPCLILATNPDTQYWTIWQHSLQSLLTIVAVYGNSSGQTSVTIAISYSTITHAWFVLIHTVYINTQQTTCNHLLKNSVHCRRTPTVCVSHSWLRLCGEPVLQFYLKDLCAIIINRMRMKAILLALALSVCVHICCGRHVNARFFEYEPRKWQRLTSVFFPFFKS